MTTPTRAPANTTFSTADLATRTIHRRAVEALIKLYPLSQAADPPETTFVDAVDVVFDGVIPYDVRFFESLNRMVRSNRGSSAIAR